MVNLSLRESCPYSKFFWSLFSSNAGKYGPEDLQVWTLTEYLSLIITDLGINKKFWLRKKYQNCYFCRKTKTKSTSFFPSEKILWTILFTFGNSFLQVAASKMSARKSWAPDLWFGCLDSRRIVWTLDIWTQEIPVLLWFLPFCYYHLVYRLFNHFQEYI